MAHIFAALVGELSTSTGTGAFALSAALEAHQRFADVCSVSDTVEYMIRHATDGSWEAGVGTYSSANTLTRTTVVESSTGSAINFAAGDKTVVLTPLASRVGSMPSGGTDGQVLAKSGTADFSTTWADPNDHGMTLMVGRMDVLL